MRIASREDLKRAAGLAAEDMKSQTKRILICAGTGCLAGGSEKIYQKLKKMAEDTENVEVEFGPEIAHVGVKQSGCHGFCEMGPLVRIEPSNYLYIKVKEEDCEEIFQESILNDRPVERLLYELDGVRYREQESIPFYAKQTRQVLKNCGHIDAENIGEYLAVGGYRALEKALFEMQPQEVIQVVLDSNLRGRGGGGTARCRRGARSALENGGPRSAQKPSARKRTLSRGGGRGRLLLRASRGALSLRHSARRSASARNAPDFRRRTRKLRKHVSCRTRRLFLVCLLGGARTDPGGRTRRRAQTPRGACGRDRLFLGNV